MTPVVLGIDTSGSWCSAALVRGPESFVRRARVGNAHSDHLLTMVDEVLVEAGIGLAGCDAIAFSAGPGSFTGLRVGCAAAQGLAFGAAVPVAVIGTLDAIAHSIGPTRSGRPRTVLVAQDARMGELYWTLIEQAGDRSTVSIGPSLSRPAALREALADRLARDPIDVGCGNAWSVCGAALDGLVARVVARETADAADVAALGVVACRDGRLVQAEAASPVYVRDDVARTTVQREADRAAAAAAA